MQQPLHYSFLTLQRTTRSELKDLTVPVENTGEGTVVGFAPGCESLALERNTGIKEKPTLATVLFPRGLAVGMVLERLVPCRHVRDRRWPRRSRSPETGANSPRQLNRCS